MSLSAAAKNIAKRILDVLGLRVVSRTKFQRTRRADREEVAQLERDLRALADREGLFADQAGSEIKWDQAQVRKYLSDDRILLFHEVINVSKRAGVVFLDRDVLDVGSGTGYLLRLIATDSPARLAGYDTYSALNAVASLLCPSCDISERDLLSSFDQSYDVIFCMETLEHIAEPKEAILNMIQNVKDGGYLVLTVPDGRRDTSESIGLYPGGKGYWGHIHFWSIESWDLFLLSFLQEFEVSTGQLGDFDSLYGIIRPKLVPPS